MRYVFLIEYDGTDFSGWQVQKNKRTVQGVLQERAEPLFGKVKFTASGRTDAGVHALGQVAQAELETSVPPEKLRECLNKVLPSDVKILKSAASDVDITREAKEKTYLYRAYYAESARPLLDRYAARLKTKPDLEKMRQALKLVEGEHDFAAFRASGFTSKTSVRIIYKAEITGKTERCAQVYELSVTGNGFLYNMVRILAGELFAIGGGKQEGFTKAFESKRRSDLAKTMPPNGLFLMNVEYPRPLFGGIGR